MGLGRKGNKVLSFCLALLLMLTSFMGLNSSVVFATPGSNLGDLVITEIATQAYNSSSYTDDMEYIEVYNNSGSDINLNNYKLVYEAESSSNYTYTIVGSPIVRAGEVIVIQNRGRAFTAFRDMWTTKAGADATSSLTVEGYYTNTSDSYNSLKNASGTVKILNPSGNALFQVTYGAGDSADFKTIKYDYSADNPGIGQNKQVQQLATLGRVDEGQVPPLIPQVTSAIPNDKQTGVLVIVSPQVTFNTSLDESTINSDSIYLATNEAGTEGKVAAVVTYSNKTVTIDPIAELSENTTYYIIIDTSIVKSSKGIPVVSSGSISFTTGVVDTVGPEVALTTPADLSGSASLKEKPQVIFNEDMNASTINSTSIFLSTDLEGNNKIAGTVSYSNKTATIQPATKLEYNTLYYINVLDTVTDLTGNALAGYETKASFTTAAVGKVLSTIPSDLTNISKTQKITLLFPYDQKANLYPYSLTNVIKVKKSGAVQYPTIAINAANPCMIDITATWTPETVYTIEILEGLQDINGNAKVGAEVLTFTVKADPKIASSIPAKDATNVALDTIPTLVFNYEMDKATVESKSNIKLQTKDGYSWYDIPYTLQLGADNKSLSIMPQSLLYPGKQYKIVVSYSAVKEKSGAALTGSGDIMFTAAGTEDLVQPTAVFAPTGTSVALGTPITVTFNKAMDKNTITKDNLYISYIPEGNWSPTIVNADVTSDEEGKVFTINPVNALTAPVEYTIKADSSKTPGIRTSTGVKLTTTLSSKFTTTAADATAPTILSTDPVNGATNASILSPSDSSTAPVVVVFSEKIKLPELGLWNDYVKTIQDPDGEAAVINTIIVPDAEGTKLSIKPNSGYWEENTKYEFTIKAGIQDLSGNLLASDYIFTVTFGELPVKLTAWTPLDQATGVSINTKPTFTFSSEMQTSGWNSVTEPTNVKLIEGADKQLSRTLTYDAASKTLTVTPAAPLNYSTSYKVVLDTNSIKDMNNMLLRGKNEISFTTEAAPIGNSSIDKTLVSFDKATPENISIQITLNGNTLNSIKNGEETLVKDTDYTIAGAEILTCTINSSYIGKLPVGNAVLTFDFSAGEDASLTIAIKETIEPAKVELVSINDTELVDGMQDISLYSNIKVRFNKELDPTTLGDYSAPKVYITKNVDLSLDSTTKFILDDPSASTVDGKTTVTVKPYGSGKLEENTTYYLVVKDEVKDLTGAGVTPFSLSFKTESINDLTITKAVLIKADDTELDIKNATSTALVVPADVKRIELTFSENIEDPTGMIRLMNKPSTFFLPVAGVQYSYSGNKAILTLPALVGNSDYKVEVYSGIKGSNNSELKNAINYLFKTEVSEAQKPHIESIEAGTTPITKDGTATIQKDAVIKVTFDKVVNNATLQNNFGVLRLFVTKVQGSMTSADKLTTAISAAVVNNKTVVTMTNAPMEYGKTYYIIGTGEIATSTGIKMDAVEYAFKVEVEPVVAPKVASSYPENWSTGFALDGRPTLTFSQEMDAATINKNTIKIGTSVNYLFTPLASGWEVEYNADTKTATVIPNGKLNPLTDYEVKVIYEDIKSAAGVALGYTSSVNFKTASGDTTPLSIVVTDPLKDALGVSVDKTIELTFNKDIDGASISGNVVVTKDGTSTPVNCGIYPAIGNKKMIEIVKPQNGWEYGQKYNVSVNKNLKAVDGNAMSEDFAMSFTVEQDIALTVVSTYPGNNAENIGLSPIIRIGFSEEIFESNPKDWIEIMDANNNIFTEYGLCSAIDNYLTIRLDGKLAPDTIYTVTVKSGIHSSLHQSRTLQDNYQFTFKTIAGQSIDRPIVYLYGPEGTVLPSNLKTLAVTFSDEMDASTMTKDAITLQEKKENDVEQALAPKLDIDISYESAAKQLVITPKEQLKLNTEYLVMLNASNYYIKNMYGNTFVNENGEALLSWTFKLVDTLSSEARLKSISIAGTPLVGFDPNKYDYEVMLPLGASVGQISAEAQDDKSLVSIVMPQQIPGVATINVVAEDKVTIKTYTITFVNAVEDITIELLTPVNEFSVGTDAILSIKAKNNTITSRTATLIVALYDDNGVFLNYVAVSSNIETGREQILTARMRLPDTGSYTVGCFVWDSLENANPISRAIEIPVK